MYASQLMFDFEYTADYTGVDVREYLEEVLDNYGFYVLGLEVGADGPANWGELSDRDMCQGGVDYFRTPATEGIDISRVLANALEAIGCTLWGDMSESVHYDEGIVRDVARWYEEPLSGVVENLIDAGYIDEYDSKNYLEK